MTNRIFILLSLFFVLTSSSAQAQNKVVVVPLGADTYQLSIESADLFSWNVLTATTDPITALTVPAQKIFVLTHVYAYQFSNLSQKIDISEDSNIKTQIWLKLREPSNIPLGSGIPFAAGTDVKITAAINTFVTLIGHLSTTP